jgi:outer membrane protein assembly factor BamB
VVSGGLLIYQVGEKVYGFDAAAGGARWVFSPQAPEAGAAGGPNPVPPVVGLVGPARMVMLNVNGRPVFIPAGAVAEMGGVAAAGGLALVGRAEGLYAGDARNGLQAWSFPTAPPVGAPAAAGGVIYFVGGPLAGPAGVNAAGGAAQPAAASSVLYALPAKKAGP